MTINWQFSLASSNSNYLQILLSDLSTGKPYS